MAQAQSQSTQISEELQARIDEVVDARNEMEDRKDELPAKTDATNRMFAAEKALRDQWPRSLADLAAKMCAINGESERDYTFSDGDADWLARDIRR